jgi:hypothetical protein
MLGCFVFHVLLRSNSTAQKYTKHATHQSTDNSNITTEHHHAVPFILKIFMILKILTLLLVDYFIIFYPLFYPDKTEHLMQ